MCALSFNHLHQQGALYETILFLHVTLLLYIVYYSELYLRNLLIMCFLNQDPNNIMKCKRIIYMYVIWSINYYPLKSNQVFSKCTICLSYKAPKRDGPWGETAKTDASCQRLVWHNKDPSPLKSHKRQRPKFRSPSPVMVMSSYKYNIYEQEVKLYTTNQSYNRRGSRNFSKGGLRRKF